MTAEERNIKEALEKSGFPLELEIASIVEETSTSDEHWLIRYNDYYYDEEQQKGREIDISATKFATHSSPGEFILRISPTILFECKKCANSAWVFFIKGNHPSLSRGQYFDTFQLIDNPTSELKHVYSFLLHNRDCKKLSTVATSYCQVRFDKPQIVEKSEIFEGTRQLVKAIRWEYLSRLGLFGPVQSDDVIFALFPTIVFDGTMYEAHLDKGALSLNPTEHVIVRTDYKAPATDFWQDFQEFYIDVVSKSSFDKWLEATNEDIRSIQDIVKDEKLMTKRLQLRSKFLHN